MNRTNTITRLFVLLLQIACWLIIAVWIIGRIANDRFLWSQFLSWIPTLISLTAALLLCVIAKFVSARQSPTSQTTSTDATRRSATLAKLFRSTPVITTIALFAWLMLVDIRLQALLTGFGSQSSTTIRLFCWNATSTTVQQMASLVKEHRPDITILTNTPFNASLVPVRDEMSAAAIASNRAPDTFVASSIRLNVISRFPVLHHAVMPLGITGAKERTFTWVGGGMKHVDTGQLMCVELDTTTALNKTTILWIIDLPSDPDIPRARMMKEFQTAVTTFAAAVLRRADDGLDRPVTSSERTEVLSRFQHPDIIAGDFNTTRNSASLDKFLDTFGTFENAKYQATGTGGVGWDFTYPRSLPLLHIDHVFVRTDLSNVRTKKYTTFDPGIGRHCVQLVDLQLPK